MSAVIDLHPHVISRDEIRYPRTPLGGKQSDWSQERPVSAPEMIAAMDEAGIERSVLVQASTCYGFDNRYVADSVAEHPSRFSGVFSVDVLAADAPERIGYWKGKGLIGLRVFVAGHTTQQDVLLNDPRSFPAWERAQQLNLPVCVQARAQALPQLAAMLERFRSVKVALDHMARPSLDNSEAHPEPLLELKKYTNLYLKLTTHNVHDLPPEFLVRVVKHFGAERVAWGSNYPAAKGKLKDLLQDARKALAGLAEREREQIFARTAKDFYAL
ncbi:MAG TPA: amidohydrolase family protein [Burkholderiales bacterium]|nr:amidohydrolase family protein [Burkholderiales bacterium]